MCKASENLKLCSCFTPIDKLDNYWVFCRFIEGKDTIIMGEPVWHTPINLIDNLHNEMLLENLLNEGNVFDVHIIPKENDRLALTFTCSKKENIYSTYGFEFLNKKWIRKDFEGFEWAAHHAQERYGEIKNAIERIIEHN